MKFGLCGYLVGKNSDGVEFDLLKATKAAGFDYIEFPMSTLARLDDAEFERVGEALARSGIPCEACNLFFPATVRLTGPDVDDRQTLVYLETSLGRARQLGVQVVVFGSGGARQAPAGFAMEQAWMQLVSMLRVAGDVARQNGITIAIEPLNKAECNLINTGAEGYTLARLVDHPNVRLLLDVYHMVKDAEDFGIAITARDYLMHAHFAEPLKRVFPTEVDEVGKAFFAALRGAGYAGRVSIEAGYGNFQVESVHALQVMRELAG